MEFVRFLLWIVVNLFMTNLLTKHCYSQIFIVGGYDQIMTTWLFEMVMTTIMVKVPSGGCQQDDAKVVLVAAAIIVYMVRL